MVSPTVWKADAFVITGTNSRDVTLSAEPTGRLVLGFTSENTAGNPNVNTARHELLTPLGPSANGGTFRSSSAIDEQMASLDAFSNGVYRAWAWTEKDDATGNFDIYTSVNVIGSTGSNSFDILPRRLVNTGATTGVQDRPEILALGENRLAITWIDRNTNKLTVSILDVNGLPQLPPTQLSASNVTQTAGGQSFRYDLAELANGNFVAAYRADEPSSSDAKFQIMTADGTFVGGEVDLDGVADSGDGATSVTTLADGRFVVIYVQHDVVGRIYNEDGSPSGGVFTVLTEAEYPNVAALHDGRFMVVGQAGDDVFARVMRADGTPDSEEFRVNDVLDGLQTKARIETLADGRVVVTWETNETGAADLKYKVYDPRPIGITLNGTGVGDEYVGSAFADVLNGGNGDDVLIGAAGNDTMNGGPGIDTMNGGTGDDTYFVNSSSDIVREPFTNSGNDAVYASVSYTLDPLNPLQPVELLATTNDNGVAPINLTGNLTANTLRGNAGANILNGRGGNDMLDGGAGSDTALFAQNLADSRVYDFGSQIVVTGDALVNIERLQFADGALQVVNDGDPLFDALFYYSSNLDVFFAGVDAKAHYDAFGWQEGRDPNPFFSSSGYLSANGDVRAAGINPLEHFRNNGSGEGRDPSALFDLQFYLIHAPDVAAAGVDPLTHYLQNGFVEGRLSSGAVGPNIDNGFDAQFYLLANADVGFAGVDPLAHFNSFGRQEGRDPNAYFDADGYLATYTDVAAAGMNPLDHYMQFGWTEGRDPSAHFDTDDYLAANPDVAANNVNPLQHFLQFGLYEGRLPFDDGVFG